MGSPLTNGAPVRESAEMPRDINSQLTEYRTKRDRSTTPEPFGQTKIPPTGKLFVVQQHLASHLHWDVRVEINGVLKSWAVPKGPSDDPADKRFAVETEDHPLDYANFEGEIPPGNYGAGHVIVWDRGQYTLLGDFAAGMEKGKLLFEFKGFKLRGTWTLVRLKTKGSSGREWLLIKEHDNYVHSPGASYNHRSVFSGLLVEQLGLHAKTLAALKRRIKNLNGTLPRRANDQAPKPMLAVAGEAHNRKGWLWELKYDGYRIVASKHQDQIKLYTRNGHDISVRFPEICQTLQHLPLDRALIDGELVVNDGNGRPNFHLMQTRAGTNAPHQVKRWAIELPATYYVFDLLNARDTDLHRVELTQRKRLLKSIIPPQGCVVYSEHVADRGVATFQAAQELGVEGVVGKRANSFYQGARSADWIKVRNSRTQEFVVIGWSGPSMAPSSVTSLALGEYRAGTLVYAGHVGSGMNQKVRTTVSKQLHRTARKTSAITPVPKTTKLTHWVRPQIVVEVAFTEYTPRGHLRHPTLQRIRDDKQPEECLSNFDGFTTGSTKSNAASLQKPEAAAITITNPAKMFFPEPGFTKSDLVNYYQKIAAWMLPYLTHRPLVLTRYPDGVEGKSFYQRNVPAYVPDWFQRETLWSESAEKEVQYLIARTPQDLTYLANMGTIPIHIWHSTLNDLANPDWCVIDLDPKQAEFHHVLKLAHATGELADEIGLPAYLKTSGASGLHVLLPLARQLSHAQAQTLGELLARVLVDRHPQIATTTRAVKKRQNKVYIDYLQNGHGRLIAAPFAVRAEVAGSVSMPLRWSEAHRGLANSKYHIGNAVRRMQRLKQDPMAGLLTDQPDLLRALAGLAKLI